MFFYFINFVLSLLCLYFAILYTLTFNKKVNVFFILILIYAALPRLAMVFYIRDFESIVDIPFWKNIGLVFGQLMLFLLFFQKYLNLPLLNRFTIPVLSFSTIILLMNIMYELDPIINIYALGILGGTSWIYIILCIRKELKKPRFEESENKYYRIWLYFMLFMATTSFIVAMNASYCFLNLNIDKLIVLYRIVSVMWMIILIFLLIHPEVLFDKKIVSNKNIIQLSSELWSFNALKPVSKKDMALNMLINKNISDYIVMLVSITTIQRDELKDKELDQLLADYLNVPKKYINFLFKYHCTYSKKEYLNFMLD